MTVDELRALWEADLELRNGILIALYRQVGIGNIAYQLEYARISLLREHLAELEWIT